MYWPFIQSSFSVLKTALPPLIPSSEKAPTSSSIDITSRSSPGDQPSSARKFTMASGRYPWRRYSVTDVAPCRLLNRFLSAPRISGTCANSGVGAPSASKQQHVLRRVRDVVVAANHVRDLPSPRRLRRPRGGRWGSRPSGGSRSLQCWSNRTRFGRAPRRQMPCALRDVEANRAWRACSLELGDAVRRERKTGRSYCHASPSRSAFSRSDRKRSGEQ